MIDVGAIAVIAGLALLVLLRINEATDTRPGQ
jgi:hypothetical protein